VAAYFGAVLVVDASPVVVPVAIPLESRLVVDPIPLGLVVDQVVDLVVVFREEALPVEASSLREEVRVGVLVEAFPLGLRVVVHLVVLLLPVLALLPSLLDLVVAAFRSPVIRLRFRS
jgi:hypothetical protein